MIDPYINYNGFESHENWKQTREMQCIINSTHVIKKNSHQHPFSNILFFLSIHHHSCPLDFVRVHDGSDNTSAVIGTYCGQQRNLVLYSSESNLFVQFSTLQRTANTQNRGFKGIFEFSESFVKLDFIREFYIHNHVQFVPKFLFFMSITQVRMMVFIFVDLNVIRKFYRRKNRRALFTRQIIHFLTYRK